MQNSLRNCCTKIKEGCAAMPTGKVKWFNNAKGYGFILTEEGNNDIFAHYSTITMDGYKSLKAGQQVEFEISQGPKGLHATEIKPVGDLQ
jgi:CspA family cold shock protein|tara:strand:+ start:3508 stop:3777 length:270 start_codon:yes stop_codon:yes gene_type:complete